MERRVKWKQKWVILLVASLSKVKVRPLNAEKSKVEAKVDPDLSAACA